MADTGGKARTLKRRDFLKAAGLAGGTAGVALALTGKPALAAGDGADRRSGGYRKTEHVSTYYKLARF